MFLHIGHTTWPWIGGKTLKKKKKKKKKNNNNNNMFAFIHPKKYQSIFYSEIKNMYLSHSAT